MTHSWNYTVFHGDSIDSLKRSVRSSEPLRADAVAGISSGGFLVAAVYIVKHSASIDEELLEHLEGRGASLPESELRVRGANWCSDKQASRVDVSGRKRSRQWLRQGAQRVSLD